MKIEQPIVAPEPTFEGWDKVTKLVPILSRSNRNPEMIFTVIRVSNCIYLFIGKDSPDDLKDINYSDSTSYMVTNVEFIRYYGPDDKLTIQGGQQ